MTIKRPNAKEQKSLGFELMKGSWRIIPPYTDPVNDAIEKYFAETYEFQDLGPEDVALAKKYNVKMYNIVFEGGTRKHAMYSYDARADTPNNHFTLQRYNGLLFYPVATEASVSIPELQEAVRKVGISSTGYCYQGKLNEEQLLSYYNRNLDNRGHMRHIPIPLEVEDVNSKRQTIVRHVCTNDNWLSGQSAYKDCVIDGVPGSDGRNGHAAHLKIMDLVAKAITHLRSSSYNKQVAAYRTYMSDNPEALNAYLEEVSTDRLKINAKQLVEVCFKIGNTIEQLDHLKTGLQNMNVGLQTIVDAQRASNRLVDRLNIFHRSLRTCNKKFIFTNNALKGLPGIDE